jgi:predicted ATPase
MLKEGGKEFPAPVLSDGTLRFAAITAAFFQPDMPGVMTIEEIENGIHASRVRLLVELLRNRASSGKTQIMATTHSPIVLAWLDEEEYQTTFFCKRDEITGESRICALPEVPHFSEVVKKQPISDLFAEGWLEVALGASRSWSSPRIRHATVTF